MQKKFYSAVAGSAIIEYLPLVALIIGLSFYALADIGYATASNFTTINISSVECCQNVYLNTLHHVIVCDQGGRVETFPAPRRPNGEISEVIKFMNRQRDTLIQLNKYGPACNLPAV